MPLVTVSLLGSHTFRFQWVLDALCFSEAPCLSGMRQNGEVENYGGVRRERSPSPGGEAGIPGWCCGGLKKNGPHRLIRSGTIRRYDLVGVNVALLEEACHLGWALWFQMLKPGLVSHSLPSACQSVCEALSHLSSTMSACPTSCSHYDDNGLKLWTCKPAPVKCLPLWELLWSWCLFAGIKALTKTDGKCFRLFSLSI